ncbi:MAG TPA: hypothetical protein VLH18_01605 [Candidatus Limnocylindrales bacterium]|nr:hypothetical protein [Candidatus Limnocylindrales bacterium]
MFLKEFSISRYGPLLDSGRRVLGSFNLFCGSNEEGKTLTIDALLRMLLGKGVRLFKAVQRVAESPEGYLIVEDDSGRETKFPAGGTLADLCGLSNDEFGNIFVIRDSDLTISREVDIYHSITNRLTGIRTDEIRKIKEKLYEFGRITVSGEFQNIAPHKLKDKLKKAEILLGQIEILNSHLQEENFSRSEEELAWLETESNVTSAGLEQYNAAYNRERYEKTKEALNTLNHALHEATALQRFNRDGQSAWQSLESNLEFLQREKQRLEQLMAKEKGTLDGMVASLKDTSGILNKLEHDKNMIAEKIEPTMTEYDQHSLVFQKQSVIGNSLLFTSSAVLFVLVFLLTLYGSIVYPIWWVNLLLVASVAFVVYYSWVQFNLLRKKAHLSTMKMFICRKAAELGLKADGIDSLQMKISQLKHDLRQEQEQQQEVRIAVMWQSKEADRISADLAEKNIYIEKAWEKLRLLRREAGVESLAEYSAALDRKQAYNSEADKQKSILQSHFGGAENYASEDDRILFWDSKVKALQQFAVLVPRLFYDENAVSILNRKLEQIEESRQKLRHKLKERSDELRDLERSINEVLPSEAGHWLPCQTAVDLEAAQRMLVAWINTQVEKKNDALAILKIFDQLETEEEQKVTALFNDASPASDYFKLITGGRYQGVILGSQDHEIKVISPDGSALSAWQLSGGAYDQLYFAIRLALGEKLMKGKKGFFILDDPFIKADPERLKTQLNMLAAISEAGWQILYFSAKAEVREALRERIEQGFVRVICFS